MPYVILVLALVGLLTGSGAWAQISPAHVPLPALQDKTPATRGDHSTDDMPLADYLGLLRQIAPAAEAGAKDYLASFEQRCGRPLTSIELRRAMSQGDGDPVLMGLIRASHLRDTTAREQLAGQIRCPIRSAR